MRFEQLSVRIPGDELKMRFHKHITILSGIGPGERRGLTDSLLGALVSGPTEGAVLSYLDANVRRVTVRRGPDGETVRVYDDGSPAPDLASLGLDAGGLHDLAVVDASAVGLLSGEMMAEPPELTEARHTLAELEGQLDAALAARQTVEAMRQELARMDEAIRAGDEGKAKRRFARLLADLERVRAEAAAVRTGETGAISDRRLLDQGRTALMLAERWHAARDELAEAHRRFGDHERLDARTLAEAEDMPDQIPPGLENLVRALEDAERRRDGLSARLSQLATSRLPEPSDPAVVRLARVDQDAVWEAAQRAIDTALRLEQESLALGGLAAEGIAPEISKEIETSHETVEEAERVVEARRKKGFLATTAATAAAAGTLVVFPLAAPLSIAAASAAAMWSMVVPRRHLAAARGHEEDVLVRAGVPTYLSFHMRRIDATIDVEAREHLDLASLEHRVALGQWHEVAGKVDPMEALNLEDEVRAYAASLTHLDGAADEVDALRAELSEVAEPAAERALRQLMDACSPFGVDDPHVAMAMVRHQADIASTARLQTELETAEHGAEHLRAELATVLKRVGFEEGEVDGRLGALETAMAAATGRQQARTRARDRSVVETELAELEARVRREGRPEWHGSVTASTEAEPDLEDLQRRRVSTAEAYETASRIVPDIDRLADRHDAVQRRVAVLESSLGDIPNRLVSTADIEQLLQARVTSARNAGPQREALPVLLDEPFIRLRSDQKWEVLDLVERLAEKTQVVYLTDDRDVVVWARRRAAAGSLALLEPVSEDVPA